MLSVVIPTLNAEATLPRTLGALIPATAQGLVREVIVSDGGSTDATLAIADATGATLVACAPGRGAQLRAGAGAARQPWLMFLHADTALEPGWEREIASFVARDGAEARAAAFRFALDDFARRARWLEAAVRWRCRLLALPYGDQGLVISRALYDEIGGFADMPLMEDVDMVRRLGRRRLAFLESRAVTSAARYRSGGYLPRMARNAALLSLYFLRVPTHVLARLYG